MAKKLRILIADDHSIFRHGLKDILVRHLSRVAVTEAENGLIALEHVRKTDWDVVVLDITMPGQNGVDVLRLIKRLKPAMPVLILSMHSEDQYAMRVIEAGASGYITKIKAPLEIVDAVKQSLVGGKYISPDLADRMVAQLKPGRRKQPVECLSARQNQIMRLIPSGKTLKEIANDLSITVQTVSTHRTRLLKKMGFRSDAELIRYALENGFVN